MNEMIKVNYDGEQPTISARDLYDIVSSDGGVKWTERFSKWFERYCSYGFTEGIDYSTPHKKVRVQMEGSRKVQREVDDYDLSVDILVLLETKRQGHPPLWQFSFVLSPVYHHLYDNTIWFSSSTTLLK